MIASTVKSQNSNLEEYYLEKADYFSSRNLDSLLFYSKKLQESKNKCIQLNGYYKESHYYYRKGDFDLTQKRSYHLIDVIENLTEDCFKIIHISTLNRLYWIYKNQNKINQAFEILVKQENVIQKVSSEISRKRYLCSYNLNLAYIKKDLGLHEEAIDLYKKLLVDLNSLLPNLQGHELNVSIST